jgi:glycosyltransferase involved in cell wall biosynthesis
MKDVKKVYVLANRFKDYPHWACPGKFPFEILHIPKVSKYTVPEDVTHLINFADGNPFVPMPPNVQHVLLLQGFGTQNYEKECVNLLYPYDKVITTSRWLANIAGKFFNCPIFIVPPGIDAQFKPAKVLQRGFVIGGLYHEAPDKNASLLASVMAGIRANVNSKVQALFLSSKSPSNIDLLEGMQCSYSLAINPPQDLIPSIYSICNIWISASSNEGFGLTTLEAMACNVPVVWMPSYGLDDYMVHRRNCMIADDKKSIIEAVKVLLNNRAIKMEIINGGSKLVAQFTWERAAEGLITALRK